VSASLWPFETPSGGDDVTVVTPLFRYSNYAEAVLWMAIGAYVVVRARRRGGVRPAHAVLAVALLLFGVSDLIEARTGAWWRPRWLLVWKGGCLLVFLGVFVVMRRRNLAGRAPIPSPGTPGEG
jgi:hypothetical protein